MQKGIYMRTSITIALSFYLPLSSAANVITCGDVSSVGDESKFLLHKAAQQRAEKKIEEFFERKITQPNAALLGQEGSEKSMAAIIETFWCETPDTPLHSAYYRFYSNNKSVFE
jgi:hypothetical protein